MISYVWGTDELDRNQFLIGIIMNQLSENIRFLFEYLFVSPGFKKPVN